MICCGGEGMWFAGGGCILQVWVGHWKVGWGVFVLVLVWVCGMELDLGSLGRASGIMEWNV